MLQSRIHSTSSQANISPQNAVPNLNSMEEGYKNNNIGQKAAYSDKVPLINGEVNFDKKICISCNMVFNPKTKTFQEKMTKFSVIITSQKGVKQAGEILFDVAKYVNSTQLAKKDYDDKLDGCPDKNAKLTYTISGVMKQELSMDDAISQFPENNHSSIKKKREQQSNYPQAPTQDKPKPQRAQKSQKKDERLKQMQEQNKKLGQQLKGGEKLRQQNEQLRKKIKAEDFKKSLQIKEKIEKYKKQIEKMKSQIRANKKIQDQTLSIQKDIFKCKVKIMKAFNYAREFGGDKLVDSLQQYCGYTEE